jgi:AraC family transcriptional regulator of adaptative response/methylated-DNA-[protein]-cysteine methyltransferase
MPVNPYTTEDARWAAVQARDSAADGVFFYAVRSTGVYCRPSCPSRPARRDNVSFHPDTAAAEAAGFRPCKRCRPDQPHPQAQKAAAIARACALIDAAEQPGFDAIAADVGMSRFHFQRVFKAVTGLTPKAWADARRAERVRAQLGRSDSVTAAIFEAGFNSSGRFYANSTDLLGMTPSNYRAGGKGLGIRFGIGQCSLGAILVAATDKGVCCILLGDDPQALVQDLQNRFSGAELLGGDAGFEQWMATVIGFVEAPGLGLDLPLDIRGTAFQQRVWQALREIPPGSTASYSEIAERIGAPKAARAVAGACAANAIAVAIPCHRVVRGDGSLSGYRWGVERKQALLEREAGR